jgi:DNA helicase IV
VPIYEENFPLKNLQNSPYFVRMDMKNDKTINTLYIGKSPFSTKNDGLRIYDWRSSEGELYYESELTDKDTFSLRGMPCSMILKRRIEIRDSELRDVQDVVSDAGGKGIHDPFLLSVLKYKRTESHITDIIATIQKKQNQIIRNNTLKNIIIQGCAGSGKTMILLHRLSYLVYNYKNFDKSRIRIITPSDTFNIFMGNLARDLELNQIDMISLEEYYKRLLPKDDKWTKKDIKRNPDFESDEFLSCVYSKEVAKEAYDSYNDSLPEIIYELKKLIETLTVANDRINESLKPVWIKRRHGVNPTKQEEAFVLFPNQLSDETPYTLYEFANTLSAVLKENNKILNLIVSDQARAREHQIDGYLEKEIEYAKAQALNDSDYDEKRYDELVKVRQSRGKKRENIVDQVEESAILSEMKQLDAKKREIEEAAKNEIIKTELERIRNIMLSDEEEKAVASTKKYSAEEVYKRTFEPHLTRIKKQYPSATAKDKGSFEYELFWYTRFHGEWADTKDDAYLMCIDEAQDISPTEYEFLRKLCGEKTYFELYGDLNQRINIKGISNWDQVAGDYKVFELMENYRNSSKITEYSNDRLHMKMQAIGSNDGKVVSIKDENQLLAMMNSLQKESVSFALIGNEKNLHSIQKLANRVSGITKNRIMTVVETKGLEFSKAIVFDKNMRDTEKYIAYTRAMNELYVCSFV